MPTPSNLSQNRVPATESDSTARFRAKVELLFTLADLDEVVPKEMLSIFGINWSSFRSIPQRTFLNHMHLPNEGELPFMSSSRSHFRSRFFLHRPTSTSPSPSTSSLRLDDRYPSFNCTKQSCNFSSIPNLSSKMPSPQQARNLQICGYVCAAILFIIMAAIM